MSKKSKPILGLVCASLIVVGSICSYYYIAGSYAGTQGILVQDVRIDDYNITLQGTTASSGTGYSGYKLVYKDKVLYIKLKYGIVSSFNPTGDFLIEEGGYFEGVQQAFLQGPDENDKRLIWSR